MGQIICKEPEIGYYLPANHFVLRCHLRLVAAGSGCLGNLTMEPTYLSRILRAFQASFTQLSRRSSNVPSESLLYQQYWKGNSTADVLSVFDSVVAEHRVYVPFFRYMTLRLLTMFLDLDVVSRAGTLARMASLRGRLI